MENELFVEKDEDPGLEDNFMEADEFTEGDTPELKLRKGEDPFDITKIQLIRRVKKHKGQINMIIYTQLSNKLISCGTDKRILIFNGDSFLLESEYKNEDNKGKLIETNYLFELNDGKIISSDVEHNITIWSINTLQCLTILKYHKSPINKISQLPNGNIISCEQNQSIKIYDPITYKILFDLKEPRERFTNFEILNDSSIYISTDYHSKSILYKYEKGKYKLKELCCLCNPKSSNYSFYDKELTKNILCGMEHGLKVINTRNWFIYKDIYFDLPKITCFIRLNGKYIIAGTEYNSFIIMNNNFEFKYVPNDLSTYNPINSIVKIDENTFVTVSGHNTYGHSVQGSMKIWKYESNN